jgi:hypothetical protein
MNQPHLPAWIAALILHPIGSLCTVIAALAAIALRPARTRLVGLAALVAFASMVALGALDLPGSAATCHAAEFNDFQTWWDISTIYKFNDRWQYAGDQGTRGFLSNEDWRAMYIRPAVRFTVRQWLSMYGGIGFSYTYQKFPGDRVEIRPWLGARFYWPRPGGFVFSHYFRLEDRFNYSQFRDVWDSAFRARYKLGLKTPTFDIAGAEGFYAVSSIELFKELSGALFERFANRGRIDVGPGKRFGESWRAELHYLYQSSGLFVQEGIQTDEHILRLRLFYVFN